MTNDKRTGKFGWLQLTASYSRRRQRLSCFVVVAFGWLLLSGCSTLESAVRQELSFANSITQARQERFQKAQQEFQHRRNWARMQLAKQSLAHGNMERAISQLEKLVSENPDHISARVMLAELLLDQGEYDRAVDLLLPAAEQSPTNSQVHYLLAVALDAAGRLQEALPHYEQACALEPDNELYAAAYQTALESAELAQETNPVRPAMYDRPNETAQLAVATACQGRGTTSGTTGQQIDTDLLQEAGMVDGQEYLGRFGSELDPACQQDLEQVETLLVAGQLDDAQRLLQNYFARRADDPSALGAALILLLQHNQPQLAVQLAQPLLPLYTRHAGLLQIVGLAHYRCGNYRMAKELFQRALALDKHDALSYVLLGYTMQKLGLEEQALGYLRTAYQLDPNLP